MLVEVVVVVAVIAVVVLVAVSVTAAALVVISMMVVIMTMDLGGRVHYCLILLYTGCFTICGHYYRR